MTAEILIALEDFERRQSERFAALTNLLENIMALLDALTSQVAQNVSVEQSAVTLIQGLAAQIAAAGTDPAALAALQTQLNTSATALAAAVAANTPAASAATPAATPASGA